MIVDIVIKIKFHIEPFVEEADVESEIKFVGRIPFKFWVWSSSGL